jgi:hypothetical protein
MMEWKQRFSGQVPEQDAAAWLPRLTAPDGHERQAAIETLARMRPPEALPGLIARVNDWVPQVRSAARSAIEQFFVDDAFPAWLDALPALVDVLRGQRADHSSLLDGIAAFMLAPQRINGIAGVREHLPPLVRRWLDTSEWRIASESRRSALLAERLLGGDVVAARWALARVEDLSGATARSALWLKAVDSPSGTVRAHALRRLCDTTPDAGIACAQRLALDPRGSVRDVALARLRRPEQTEEIRQLAEAQLRATHRAPHGGAPALLFLAAVDSACATVHSERLLALTGSARPPARLRALALQQLIASCTGEAQQRWLKQAVGDASAQVQRVAVEAVARGVLPPSPAELWPLVLEHRQARSLKTGLSLLRLWGTWTQLEELLKLVRLPLPDGGAKYVARALVQWELGTRRGVSAPAEPLASQLRGEWRASAPLLMPGLRRQLQFALEVAGLLPKA